MASGAKESATEVANHLGVMQCQVAKLSDDDLAAIFIHLPPYERLIVSAVCRKWQDVSKTPWRDVTHLDLSHVPTQNIHAVLRKCPNLTSVSALRQNLGDLGRFASRLQTIASLNCVDCTFTIDPFVTSSLVVDASIRSAAWLELIWHASKTVVMDSDMPRRVYLLPYASPFTLRRLQISGVSLQTVRAGDIYEALGQLPELESCILADVDSSAEDCFGQLCFNREVRACLDMSTNLRELYIQSPCHSFFKFMELDLRALEILFLNNVDLERTQTSLERLITGHTQLRVLVLTASRVSDFDGEILIPARKLFPHGFDAPPVAQLHLFLGKTAAERLRFQPSPSDALKIYPIDASLPEFLEKEEIKPIFEGSWIASRIKEGAKEGVNLTDYSFEGNAESILFVQQ